MGSKGRIPPPHLRRPHPGPGMVHPDAFAAGVRPALGAFSPFDMLPPPEVMEQKLAAQHVEMQRLATENQRLASTHGTLRQELAAAQHELQVLHAQIGAMKSEREQQMRGLMDKISKMEAELKAAEPVKSELQQARTDAQNLVVAREELMSKVHQLSQDLPRARADIQQMPALISELENLRQEYQHCRATYDYEKKFYNDHLESLQAMEKNYITMAREVDKLRAELMNAANADRRAGGHYNDNEGPGHPSGHNAYEDGYSVPQGHGPLSAAIAAAAVANAGAGATYVGSQSGPTAVRAVYDVPRGGYDQSKLTGYDAQRGANNDNIQRGPGYDMQRGSSYDMQRGSGYDAPARSAAGPHGQLAHHNNVPYGSATPPSRAGTGYEAPPRVGNPVRR